MLHWAVDVVVLFATGGCVIPEEGHIDIIMVLLLHALVPSGIFDLYKGFLLSGLEIRCCFVVAVIVGHTHKL